LIYDKILFAYLGLKNRSCYALSESFEQEQEQPTAHYCPYHMDCGQPNHYYTEPKAYLVPKAWRETNFRLAGKSAPLAWTASITPEMPNQSLISSFQTL
jgi:hypothetical protein